MKPKRSQARFALLSSLALACLGILLPAQPPIALATKPDHPNPLAGLPSPPGAHLQQIQSLADNAWLELGPPAPDTKWGSARGRSWTSQMPLAPNLRGAFLYGEGVHGYVKPDGHYMDDLWFYDVHAHRWICCYPGANARALQLRIGAGGFEVDAHGRPVPVAQQVHGYEMNTYDTHRGRLMSIPNLHDYWKHALPQRVAWLKPPPGDASPWFFDVHTGRWDRQRTATAAPPSGYGDNFLYIPSRRQAFFAHRSHDVWFYDPQANRWAQAAPQGPPPPFGIDAVSCYDSKRERIYIGGGSYPVAEPGTNAFWIYDLKQDRWIDPRPAGAPVQGTNSYPTKNAVLVYDSANDKVLLVVHSHHDSVPERVGVYVYDPASNAWADKKLSVPDALGRARTVKNGFYDPQLNAVFLHSAHDSQPDGTIWVYRHAPARE